MAEILYTTFESFTSDVLDSDVPVLVQFTAPWCGPCKAMQPHLQQVHDALSASSTGRVVKVNIDEDMEIAAEFEVQTVPTFILFWNGEPVDRSIGSVGVQGLVDLFLRNSSHADSASTPNDPPGKPG